MIKTKYACVIRTKDGWDTIALFSNEVSLMAMTKFALTQYDYWNSLMIPCDAINIVDINTGAILWDSYSYFHSVDEFERMAE